MKKDMKNKVAVETNDGYKLIGYIVEPRKDVKEFQLLSFISNFKQDGIWLLRERNLTFLSKENVKHIRDSKPFESEIDGPLVM
jgi:hypothetical protein